MTSQLITSYRETNIAKESSIVINVKLESQLKKDLRFSFSFLRKEHLHSKIFELIKPGHGYARMLSSLYFDKKFTAHFQATFTFSKFQ